MYRRKLTLVNKAHELARYCDVDVALIVRSRSSGRYFTYNSTNSDAWPPSKEHIVSRKLSFTRTYVDDPENLGADVPLTSGISPTQDIPSQVPKSIRKHTLIMHKLVSVT